MSYLLLIGTQVKENFVFTCIYCQGVGSAWLEEGKHCGQSLNLRLVCGASRQKMMDGSWSSFGVRERSEGWAGWTSQRGEWTSQREL